MLCKLHIIRPHESLGSKNSHSQKTPRIGEAQLTSARTPTTRPSPLPGSPNWQHHTHPPSQRGQPLPGGTLSEHRSHLAGQSFRPQGLTKGSLSGGARRRQPRVIGGPKDCLPSTIQAWNAQGTEAHGKPLKPSYHEDTGPCGGGAGKAALAPVRCWTAGPLANVLV